MPLSALLLGDPARLASPGHLRLVVHHDQVGIAVAAHVGSGETLEAAWAAARRLEADLRAALASPVAVRHALGTATRRSRRPCRARRSPCPGPMTEPASAVGEMARQVRRPEPALRMRGKAEDRPPDQAAGRRRPGRMRRRAAAAPLALSRVVATACTSHTTARPSASATPPDCKRLVRTSANGRRLLLELHPVARERDVDGVPVLRTTLVDIDPVTIGDRDQQLPMVEDDFWTSKGPLLGVVGGRPGHPRGGRRRAGPPGLAASREDTPGSRKDESRRAPARCGDADCDETDRSGRR